MVSPDFYKTKKFSELNEEEWERLCDGCGNCCFQKIITGYGKRQKVHFTRIACNLLDMVVGQLTGYRFGYELLMLNGLLTFCGLCLFRRQSL